MLRFDRYLLAHSRALDLATGCVVDLERTTRARTEIPLFHGRNGRTLIDFEAAATHRVEMWEHWRPRGQPRDTASIVGNFVELLECARLGAPRAFDLTAPHHVHAAYVRRVLAREARVRGWVPVALGMLASVFREHRNRPPLWLADRSLIVFVDAPCVDRDDMLALLRLARRDTRPHVLVRTLPRQWPGRVFLDRPRLPAMVHELHESAEIDVPSPAAPDSVTAEASARWQQLLEGAAGQPPSPAGAVALARVLVARDQLFEARALADSVPHDDAEWGPRAAAVVAAINERTASRASKGWEMVDELVGVLQLCQDVEDERTALARVGAFVCERLQASSVAFVARDGMSPRVLTRVGSSAAGMDVAMRSIETGLPIAPGRPEGPVESACPVRHATEVIGALWCRWSAGMPVAPQQAATLLGVAAVAAAPSVRLALARVAPALARDNPVPELVGESAAIVAVRDAIVRAAASPFSVLIEGASGR